MVQVEQRRREHHYVPTGLLRPWVWSDNQLRANYWDEFKQQMRCKRKGVRGFGFQLDLLTLQNRHGLSDELERVFERIDSPGFVARDKLLSAGPCALSHTERCDLARLLMSLQLRRPANVIKVREQAAGAVALIDNDPEVVERFRAEGIEERPSDWYSQMSGEGPVGERSFFRIMCNVADHPETGSVLINAKWQVVELGPREGTFILGDKPLTVLGGLLSDKWAWALPLTPRAALWVRPAGSGTVVRALHFRKWLNRTTFDRAERYVFVSDGTHSGWLAKAFQTRKAR